MLNLRFQYQRVDLYVKFGDNSRPLGVEHIKKDIDVVCILELIELNIINKDLNVNGKVIQMRAFINDYVPKACLIDETLMTDFEKEPEMFTVNTDVPQNNNESNTVEESTAPTENLMLKNQQHQLKHLPLKNQIMY